MCQHEIFFHIVKVSACTRMTILITHPLNPLHVQPQIHETVLVSKQTQETWASYFTHKVASLLKLFV